MLGYITIDHYVGNSVSDENYLHPGSRGSWSPGAASVGYQGGLYTGPGLSVTQFMNNATINNANAHAVSTALGDAFSIGFGDFHASYSGEAGVTTEIGYVGSFNAPSGAFVNDPYGLGDSGETSEVATVAPPTSAPNGVQPGNPNLQPIAPNNAGLPADAQPAANWSPYRWLYTGAFWGGDGRAPDNVYQAGVAAAAEWWDKNGAIRGVSVGVRANIGEGSVRINVAAGASVTIDKGFGGHASAGANLRSGALNTTLGGGVQYTEQNGWSSRPGASATVAGGRVSTGTADGGVGNLNIGFSTGGPVAITAGFVVDQHRAVNNVRETITIVRSWFGGPGP